MTVYNDYTLIFIVNRGPLGRRILSSVVPSWSLTLTVRVLLFKSKPTTLYEFSGVISLSFFLITFFPSTLPLISFVILYLRPFCSIFPLLHWKLGRGFRVSNLQQGGSKCSISTCWLLVTEKNLGCLLTLEFRLTVRFYTFCSRRSLSVDEGISSSTTLVFDHLCELTFKIT